MPHTAADDPLYREICLHPEDDTLRLAYADWLDEHGDPDRAEFIRLQFRLRDWPHRRNPDPYAGDLDLRPRCGNHWCRKLDPCHRCVDWAKAVVRQEDLIAAHPEWTVVPCPAMGGPGPPCGGICPACGGSGVLLAGYHVDYASGLPAAVWCPLADVWRDGAPTAWAAEVVRHTPVTMFVMNDREPELYEVAGAHEWTWSRAANGAPLRHTIPDAVFDLLAGYAPSRLSNAENLWRDYDTPAAAVEAAAAALGKWVRRGNRSEVT